MNDFIYLLFQPAAWPLLLIFILVPSLAIFGHRHRARMERAVFAKGIEMIATIIKASVDEGDCNVRYHFVDPATGKEHFPAWSAWIPDKTTSQRRRFSFSQILAPKSKMVVDG